MISVDVRTRTAADVRSVDAVDFFCAERPAAFVANGDVGALSLDRTFTLDDDPDAIGHFLAQAGFVHLANVFDENEMHAVSHEMDAAEPRYSPGDGRSWWAATADGEQRLVRMQYFHEA